jgi:hypothetical protein
VEPINGAEPLLAQCFVGFFNRISHDKLNIMELDIGFGGFAAEVDEVEVWHVELLVVLLFCQLMTYKS